MKKLITLILGIAFVYSCSTSTDGNGNSTTTVVPVAPSNLTGTVASSTQINLSWTDNSTNETGFKIERKTGTGTYAIIGTTATDVTTFNDTGLSQGTTYTYRVYSNNAVGNSLTYSNEKILTTLIEIPGIAGPNVTDIDGNVYQTVTNCNSTWTTTNLNVSRYRNGDIIPQVTDATQWRNLTTGAWCYYANTSSNGTTYGKLYNWYAVNDSRGLAPVGYHIPSETEWNNLKTCLGGMQIAGGRMKEVGTTHWSSPNASATNSSGFTAIPGGYRNIGNNFAFGLIGTDALWWSSTPINNDILIFFTHSVSGHFNHSVTQPYSGLNVRCVKD
jgi:uncharacterized protein (TIGR02145 family)